MTECMLVEATSDSHICGEDTQDNGNTMTCDPNGDYPNAPPGEGMDAVSILIVMAMERMIWESHVMKIKRMVKNTVKVMVAAHTLTTAIMFTLQSIKIDMMKLSDMKSYLSSGNLDSRFGWRRYS